MIKTLIGTIVIMLGVFVLIVLTFNNSQQTKVEEKSESLNSSVKNNQEELFPESSKAVFTTQEVKKHNSSDDCWTIIDRNVYDITSYIPRHPGGDEILKACGADGSSLFNSRTTADGEQVGSGTPHSSNAASQLEDFKVGSLDN